MPVKPCTRKGKSGLKYGNSGKCYTGANKRAKVTAQRKAIKASQSRSKRRSSS